MTTLKELFKEKMQTRRKNTDILESIREAEEPIVKHSRKELREIAYQKGIKGARSLNLKTLCESLDIPLVKNETFDKYNREVINKPVKITFTAVDGEKMEFPSIYNAASSIGKNPSCIPFFIRKKSTVLFKGKNWTVSR